MEYVGSLDVDLGSYLCLFRDMSEKYFIGERGDPAVILYDDLSHPNWWLEAS